MRTKPKCCGLDVDSQRYGAEFMRRYRASLRGQNIFTFEDDLAGSREYVYGAWLENRANEAYLGSLIDLVDSENYR